MLINVFYLKPKCMAQIVVITLKYTLMSNYNKNKKYLCLTTPINITKLNLHNVGQLCIIPAHTLYINIRNTRHFMHLVPKISQRTAKTSTFAHPKILQKFFYTKIAVKRHQLATIVQSN